MVKSNRMATTEKESSVEVNSYFYFDSDERFLLCDTENCVKSDRTYDILVFDLANNEKLLDKLHLYYM